MTVQENAFLYISAVTGNGMGNLIFKTKWVNSSKPLVYKLKQTQLIPEELITRLSMFAWRTSKRTQKSISLYNSMVTTMTPMMTMLAKRMMRMIYI